MSNNLYASNTRRKKSGVVRTTRTIVLAKEKTLSKTIAINTCVALKQKNCAIIIGKEREDLVENLKSNHKKRKISDKMTNSRDEEIHQQKIVNQEVEIEVDSYDKHKVITLIVFFYKEWSNTKSIYKTLKIVKKIPVCV